MDTKIAPGRFYFSFALGISDLALAAISLILIELKWLLISWNPHELKQPGPVCLLCCPAALQSSLQPSCWWVPCHPHSWGLVKCLWGQLFTSVPAMGIFSGCMRRFLESFWTATVLYSRHIPQGSGGGGVRISFEVSNPLAETESQNRIFRLQRASRRGNTFKTKK